MIFFTLILSLVLGRIAPALNATTEIVVPKNSTVSVEQLPWSPDRRLSWNDFKASPDSTNGHHAMTAANLTVDAKCNGSKFNYTVSCVFLPTESWSKNKKSSILLQHEQMHFDLTEVHARMLRKKLQALGSSCANVQTNLNETVSAAFQAWKADQKRFDEVSNHGLDLHVSEKWAIVIHNKLKQLENYR